MISTGLPCDQVGGRTVSSAAIAEPERSARRPPSSVKWSVASTPAPPPLVRMARRSPVSRGCRARISAAVKRPLSSRTRRTPARRKVSLRGPALRTLLAGRRRAQQSRAEPLCSPQRPLPRARRSGEMDGRRVSFACRLTSKQCNACYALPWRTTIRISPHPCPTRISAQGSLRDWRDWPGSGATSSKLCSL